VRGVRARFLSGRWERGSALVGMDSGMGSDIVVVVVLILGVGCLRKSWRWILDILDAPEVGGVVAVCRRWWKRKRLVWKVVSMSRPRWVEGCSVDCERG
jgi:hypothetical protein